VARSKPADGDDTVGELYARARVIDPPAWAARDRLEAARGVNPDILGERPRSAAEKRMQDRRMHSLKLAIDEQIAGDDPAIARALRSLDPVSAH
jgi:hypothetical protein